MPKEMCLDVHTALLMTAVVSHFAKQFKVACCVVTLHSTHVVVKWGIIVIRNLV